MSEEVKQNEAEDLIPRQLTDEKLEYIFVGLLLNNPKALSVYYFIHEAHFSTYMVFGYDRSFLSGRRHQPIVPSILDPAREGTDRDRQHAAC